MSLLINTAQAATSSAQAQQANPMASILMLVGMLAVLYFVLWMPQKRRAKEHRDLIGGLTKGDEVIISGGLVGKINKITDNFVVLNVAEGMDIKVQKSAISASLPKGTIKSI